MELNRTASENPDHRPELTPEHAVSDRNVNITLVGTTLGILTFVLFFLFPRASSGEVNGFYFQIAIAIIVSAMFSFTFSGMYLYLLTYTGSKKHRQIGNVFFSFGVSLMSLEPAFILFTLGLMVVATFALVLWIAFIFLYLLETRRNRVSMFS